MQRFVLLSLALAVALAVAGAQPDPNQPAANHPNIRNNVAIAQPIGIGMPQVAVVVEGPGQQPIFLGGGNFGPNASNSAMELTPNGLFVVANGLLVKFDPQTLTQQGEPVKLFEDVPFPMMQQRLDRNMAQPQRMLVQQDVDVVQREQPAQPNPPADQNQQDNLKAMQRWQHAMQLHMATPVIVKGENSLIVIVGDTFTRVNQKTMEVEAKTSLADPADPNPAPINPGAPALKLANGTLYLLSYPKLLAIDANTGKVLTRGTMPVPVVFNQGLGVQPAPPVAVPDGIVNAPPARGPIAPMPPQ